MSVLTRFPKPKTAEKGTGLEKSAGKEDLFSLLCTARRHERCTISGRTSYSVIVVYCHSTVSYERISKHPVFTHHSDTVQIHSVHVRFYFGEHFS